MTTPCEIAGIKFEHNVWNAPVPTTWQELQEISTTSAGAIVIKTHTLNKRIGNPDEYHLYEWGCRNNIALHNMGTDRLADHLEKTKYGKPVFVSIYGTIDELTDIIRCLNVCNPQDQLLIEINLSCPNAKELKYSGDSVFLLPLQAQSNYPVGVKIGYEQLVPLGSPAFITVINSVNGISGRCIQEKALVKIRKLARKFPNIPIIGCGGAETLADIDKFVEAGAIAVEIGTGYLRWGPQVFTTREKLLNTFVKRDQTWVLSSGATSDIYIDFRFAPSKPFIWKQLIELSVDKIKNLNFDYICGVPHGAVPLATALAQRLHIPLLMLRKKAKVHGTKQMIEGEYKHGSSVLLIEDVVTTGKSVNDAKKVLEEIKLVVNDTFCLFNRSDREMNSLFSLKDLNITPTERLRKIIQQKRTRLVFAADIDDPEKLLEILQGVAPHICMVKLHLDLINNIPPDFYDRILALSQKFNFLIMDDRKYVDIGAVVVRQIEKAKQITPIHFITVHAAAGPRVLDAVPNNIDVFLVTDMSQEGSQECKMFDHRRISGIVSQKHQVPGLLRMIPGISMGQETDQFGQKYRQPTDINAELYVVGRGIYTNRMPSRAAKEFKDKLECNIIWM